MTEERKSGFKLARIDVLNFRNIARVTINVSAQFAVLLGPAGGGKSNALKAVAIAAHALYRFHDGGITPGERYKLGAISQFVGDSRSLPPRFEKEDPDATPDGSPVKPGGPPEPFAPPTSDYDNRRRDSTVVFTSTDQKFVSVRMNCAPGNRTRFKFGIGCAEKPKETRAMSKDEVPPSLLAVGWNATACGADNIGDRAAERGIKLTDEQVSAFVSSVLGPSAIKISFPLSEIQLEGKNKISLRLGLLSGAEATIVRLGLDISMLQADLSKKHLPPALFLLDDCLAVMPRSIIEKTLSALSGLGCPVVIAFQNAETLSVLLEQDATCEFHSMTFNDEGRIEGSVAAKVAEHLPDLSYVPEYLKELAPQ